MNPTIEQANTLQAMWDYLNENLWEPLAGKALPPALVVLTRNGKVTGGYHGDKMWQNDEGQEIAEIGINSNCLAEGDLLYALNVLIHEQGHLWQYAHGKPSRSGYHNREWADLMIKVGLQPKCYDSDAKEDQVTGQAVGTTIIPGGAAERVIAEMSADDKYDMPWFTTKEAYLDSNGQPQPAPGSGDGEDGEGQGQGRPSDDPYDPRNKKPGKPKPGKGGSRTKYTCPICGLNVWAKHGALIGCLECNKKMVAQV